MAVAELPAEARSRIERENGWRQFYRTLDLIRQALASPSTSLLTPAVICELNALAVDRLVSPPGAYRTEPCAIDRSAHAPPLPRDLDRLVEELCLYLEAHVGDRSPMHLAAYAMWRVNWVHPFEDGNGRTARAASYLVLCTCIGEVLTGTTTMMELVAKDKAPYWAALEDADRAWRSRRVDVSMMETFMERCLAEQLATDPGLPADVRRELLVLASIPVTPPADDE